MGMMISPALKHPKSLWSHNPLPTGCKLYLPLWSPGLNGPAFKSADPFRLECAVTGATQVAKGRDFNGTDTFISLPDNLLDAYGTGSLIVWVNPDAVAADCLFISTDLTNASRFIQIAMRTTNKFTCEHKNQWVVNGDTVLSTGTPYMLTITHNGTAPKLYVNTNTEGLTFTSEIDKTKWFDDVAGVTHSYFLGKFDRSTGAGSFLNGVIGEVYFNENELTIAEITYYYNQTRGRYE